MSEFTELFIIISIILVFALVIVKDKNKVKTKITLGKKYRNENIYFSKDFNGILPKIDSIKIYDESIMVQHCAFNIETGLLEVFAVDLKDEWKDYEYNFLIEEEWERQNIRFIRIS